MEDDAAPGASGRILTSKEKNVRIRQRQNKRARGSLLRAAFALRREPRKGRIPREGRRTGELPEAYERAARNRIPQGVAFHRLQKQDIQRATPLEKIRRPG